MRRVTTGLVFLCFLFTSIIAPIQAHAGDLQNVKDAIEKEDAPKGDSDSHEGHRHHHDRNTETFSGSPGEVVAASFFEILLQFFLAGVMENAGESFPEMRANLKAEESPALPVLRFESQYQYLTERVSGVAAKAELGYMTFGVDGEYLRYFESSPNDSLTFISSHFLLRGLFAETIGANLALGMKQVRGGRTRTGFEFGIPFYIFIGKHFIVDALPYISTIHGKDMVDIGGGLSFKYGMLGTRVGYRAINVNDVTLHGPQIGLFFQW